MLHWDDCLDARLLDRFARGPAVADHDDPASWADLGQLVALLMRAAVQLDLREPAPRAVASIFQYWDQPEPPPDVAACLASWRDAGVPVQTFDYDSARDYLARHFGGDVLQAFLHAHHPSAQSDILRMARLSRDGGLYVDADDAFVGDAPIPSFRAGSAVMPLAVCRDCPASLAPRVDDAHAGLAWYYLGSAPWYAEAGHPFVARSLARAVEAMLRRRRDGERARIHGDVGPGCVSMAALDYARACLRAGRPCDLQVAAWPFIDSTRWLDYKSTERNWRTDAVLYPAGTDARRAGVSTAS